MGLSVNSSKEATLSNIEHLRALSDSFLTLSEHACTVPGGEFAVFGGRHARFCLKELGKIIEGGESQALGDLAKTQGGLGDQMLRLTDFQIAEIFHQPHARLLFEFFHQGVGTDPKMLAHVGNGKLHTDVILEISLYVAHLLGVAKVLVCRLRLVLKNVDTVETAVDHGEKALQGGKDKA